MVGRVVSVKMEKTAVVVVESKKTHAMYKKSFVYTKKFLVDDPFNVSLGDIVIFDKIAPISKRKHWRISKVLGKDMVSIEEAGLLESANESIAEVMPETKELSVETEQSAEVEEATTVKVKKETKVSKAKKAKEAK